ncbi:MAG: hypothetical protein SV375_22065 [Thermodesulfobacteriota bacterium]|nr:hypothetical protein [Thermodesulfobacteriota bacterium]
MKKKIGTMLDEDLLFQAKQVALLQKQPFTQLLENALRMYLLTLEKKTKFKQNNISQSTRGAMSIPRSTLKKIMAEKGVYEA